MRDAFLFAHFSDEVFEHRRAVVMLVTFCASFLGALPVALVTIC